MGSLTTCRRARGSVLLTLFLVMAPLISGAALAMGQTYNSAKTFMIRGSHLAAYFTEVGLTPDNSVSYRLLADVSATFDCQMPGGGIATARTLKVPGASITATFNSGKDGEVTTLLRLNLSDIVDKSNDSIGCRKDWMPILREISYTRIQLSNLANGKSFVLQPTSQMMPLKKGSQEDGRPF